MPTSNSHAQSANAVPDTGTSLNTLLACGEIADGTARLACFDSRTSQVKAEIASGDLVPVYKAEIRAARRGLFGIDRISVPQFLSSDSEEISEIETTIVSANRSPAGVWRFVLADGSEWEQLDTSNPYFSSRPGTEVRIRRGAMNSYLLTVGRASAIRVNRRR